MNQRDVFALSNDPSKTAFQPIDEDKHFEPRRRTPTIITFKASEAILSANGATRSYESASSSRLEKRQTNNDRSLDGASHRNEPLNEEDRASSNSEPFPDCTSRSNSSNQSLLSDELSCLTFNSITRNQQASDTVVRLDSAQSVDSSSLYNTQALNKHLLISDKRRQLLIGGTQLPAGVCCVLASKPMSKSTQSIKEDELLDDRELFDIFSQPEEEDPLSPDDRRRPNFELLEIPKKTKKRRTRSHSNKSSSSKHVEQRPLTSRQLSDLISNRESQSQMNDMETKPQFRFTRYDTVDEDGGGGGGGGNHIKLMAIDHLPSQAIFQNSSDIANLNQARLIKTNLVKPKCSKANKTSQSQPNTNNNQIQLLNSIGQLPNGGYTIVPQTKLGLIATSKCNCDQHNREINNNVCLECENTKKILQSNLVQLIPLGSGHSTSNSNVSPLSIQISPLSSAHSTCSGGQLNSNTISSASVGVLPTINTTNPLQSVSAPIASTNAGNVFNYDAATIHQYAISLNDPLLRPANGQLIANHNLQDRASSSLSGYSDPLGQPINNLISSTNLPTVRSVSSCAQYNIIPSMQEFNQAATSTNLPNQFQPISSNQSRSEQNLVSSNRFSTNNQATLNAENQSNSLINQQRQQFYSQPHIYNSSPNPLMNNGFNNPMINQNLNQINGNQMSNQNGHFNRPYRLSFRTPSPTLLTSSSLADSGLESPSATYVDNNDSVNIFNKYQLSSSSNAYFNSYFYTGPKEHDFFRKAVPTLPVIIAILLCILNWFLPGSGMYPISFITRLK